MNTAQAKKLSLPNIMAKLGYEPTQITKGGQEYWYKSPFRTEDDASFHTSYLGGKWIWNDFGDSGGTVIDFILRHENFNQVSQALRFLERMYQPQLFTKPAIKRAGEGCTKEPELFSFQQQGAQPPKIKMKSELEFIEAHNIRNPLIFSYLENRAIAKPLADRYLLEIKYRNSRNDKEYFAFGMKNESKGYEIRAASDEYSFKSALIKKDITFIKGSSSTKDRACLFEGMTDFLSYLALMNTDALSGDTIIMHSLASFDRTAERIRQKDYNAIHIFLDNDKAGREHTKKFIQILDEKSKPQNDLYASYKDLNDALKANQVPDFGKFVTA